MKTKKTQADDPMEVAREAMRLNSDISGCTQPYRVRGCPECRTKIQKKENPVKKQKKHKKRGRAKQPPYTRDAGRRVFAELWDDICDRNGYLRE